MKTTLKQAIAALQRCSAVIWGDSFLTLPNVSNPSGEGNEFLTLETVDEEGREFSASFLEEDNQEVTVADSSMFLTDSGGEDIQVTLLNPVRVSWLFEGSEKI